MFTRALAIGLLVSTVACQSVAPTAPSQATQPSATAPPPPTQPAPQPDPFRTAGQVSAPTPRPPFTPLPLQTPNPGGLDPRFGIAEGFRDATLMAEIGAGWERVVLSWADIQPNGPDDFSWLGRTLPPRALAGELNRGVRMAGLLQFTPRWAATNLADPGRSVPRNLELAYDDPRNHWGRFVYETVRYYTGRIDEWIVWNEPEFRPGDAAGSGTYTWLGSDEQFAQLMQVAYRAAKKANPRASVAFPGTSYWIDRNNGQLQFYERYLRLVSAVPDAGEQGFFHDAVPLNLYRAADDLVRLHRYFKDIQKRYGLDKPMWLLELNAMPSDDRTIPCADRHAGTPIQTTQAEQAAYAIQALSVAAAIGYERIGFYQMVDDNPCRQAAVWGISRDDGSRRPVAQALRTAIRSFAGYLEGQFSPLVRRPARWSAWPADPDSIVPNWQIYEVVFLLPDSRRVTVLWNGDGTALRVRIPRHSSRARVLDAMGEAHEPMLRGADWVITLPAATAHFVDDPAGYFFIGGEPRILIEEGVVRGTPVLPPRLD